MTGKARFFNDARGYGFIVPDDGGNDVFVDAGSVARAGLKTLTRGQRLSYEIETDHRGRDFAVKLEVTSDDGLLSVPLDAAWQANDSAWSDRTSARLGAH